MCSNLNLGVGSSYSNKDKPALDPNTKPDGLILSGGEDIGINIRRDNLEKKLIKYFTRKKKPILGICRGMQVLSIFFGSNLKKLENKHFEYIVEKVKNHVNTRHECKPQTKDKLFPRSVNSYHNYAIKKCPKDFLVTTKSSDGTIESIKHLKYKWEGWMWHPERDKPFSKCLKNRALKIFK